MWKTFCMKFCKKCCEPLRIFLTSEKETQQALRKHFFFLMRSCSIHILVLHSGNGHMQKSISCYLRLSTWTRKNFSKIAVIKASNHLTLGMTVLVMKDTSMKIFFNTYSACLAQEIRKKTTSCNFWLNTWKQTKFQRNCSNKEMKSFTFDKEDFC